jgi:hypothetical protein
LEDALFIQLIIVACLVDGTTCRDFPHLYDARGVSLLTCMIAAHPELARWQAEHHKWQLQKWCCEPIDPRRSKT